MYITADQKSCIENCDNNFKNGRDKNGRRTCVCKDNKFYDVAKSICVSIEECEEYTYRLNGDVM